MYVYLPWFGLSKVQVIDAVEIHVLCVPCKGGLPHAKIQVWCVDTFNRDPAVMLHGVQNSPQVANIPLFNILPE